MKPPPIMWLLRACFDTKSPKTFRCQYETTCEDKRGAARAARLCLTNIHVVSPQAIQLSRDGQYLLTGGDNGVVMVWQMWDLKQLFAYPGCDAGIRSMALSYDQRLEQVVVFRGISGLVYLQLSCIFVMLWVTGPGEY